jgi:hypothetical protein
MGIKLQWERVLEIAGEAAPGRPHVAQALVEGGFVPHFREAFNRYLGNDGPAYVEVRGALFSGLCNPMCTDTLVCRRVSTFLLKTPLNSLRVPAASRCSRTRGAVKTR